MEKMKDYLERFIEEHNFDENYIRNHQSVFNRVIRSLKMCENCKGLDECTQLSKGEHLSLSYKGVLIEEIEYCDYAKKVNETEDLRKKYVYCDIPYSLMNIDMNNISFTEAQKYLYAKYLGILHGKSNIGLYVYGDMGTGKTYLSIALANSLIKNGKKVAFVKVSDFFNTMKSYFSADNTVSLINKTINDLKRCEYLFLDDIGAESVSEFVRDDVLLRILEYRMEHNLCTVFTSNLKKEELQKHYQYDRKEKSNLMKSRRLMERIDILTEDFVLSGEDLRRK
ncbi:MAG: ATP-binding protein [Erysipelotrichaceae bacterium]|nr:ATP-binding protein [Erysipelotrichaceae bacterium]